MKYVVILLIATAAAVGIYYYRQKPIPRESVPQKQSVTITGEVVCLPHKQTDGPITLECALGLKDSKGIHYGLRDTSPEDIPAVMVGDTITAQGTLVPDPESQYDIVGIIDTNRKRQ